MADPWTKEKSASWIHEALIRIQAGFGAHEDGFYSKTFHAAIKAALRAKGILNVDDIDADGPMSLAMGILFEVVTDEHEGKALQEAWAWWVVSRSVPQGRAAAEDFIAKFNATLATSGSEAIDAKTAEDYFVGDKAAAASGWRKVLPYVAGAIVLLCAGIVTSSILSRRAAARRFAPALVAPAGLHGRYRRVPRGRA